MSEWGSASGGEVVKSGINTAMPPCYVFCWLYVPGTPVTTNPIYGKVTLTVIYILIKYINIQRYNKLSRGINYSRQIMNLS